MHVRHPSCAAHVQRPPLYICYMLVVHWIACKAWGALHYLPIRLSLAEQKSRIAYAYYMYHYIIFLTTDSLGGTPWVFAPSPSTARSQRSLKASTRSACRIVDSSRRLTFRDSHSACSTVAASKETSKPWPDHQPERQGHLIRRQSRISPSPAHQVGITDGNQSKSGSAAS
jgi:hypothetical protein